MDTGSKAVKDACSNVLKNVSKQRRHLVKKDYFDKVDASQLSSKSPVPYLSDEEWQALLKLWLNPKHMVFALCLCVLVCALHIALPCPCLQYACVCLLKKTAAVALLIFALLYLATVKYVFALLYLATSVITALLYLATSVCRLLVVLYKCAHLQDTCRKNRVNRGLVKFQQKTGSRCYVAHLHAAVRTLAFFFRHTITFVPISLWFY